MEISNSDATKLGPAAQKTFASAHLFPPRRRAGFVRTLPACRSRAAGSGHRTVFKPTMPTKISDRKNIRQKVTASWKQTMPSTTVPMPPMPVQIM